MEHQLDKKLRDLDAKKIGAQIKVLETEIEIKKVIIQQLNSDEYQNKDTWSFKLSGGKKIKPIRDIKKSVSTKRVKLDRIKK